MDLKKYFDAANAATARVQEIAVQINELFEQGKIEEAQEQRAELDRVKAEEKEAHQLYLSMQNAMHSDGESDPAMRFIPAGNKDAEPKEIKELRASNEYSEQYWRAFKNGVTPQTIENGQHNAERYGLLINALTETGGTPPGSEGGFLNPIEFDNMIIERQRQFIDLAQAQYFNVETVTAYSGWRDIETKTAELPFPELTEMEVLDDDDETESPTFNKITYTIKDYGGFLRVGNSLLSDTPVNIMAYLARWFGKKVVLTNNSLILAIVNALTPTNVDDYKNILSALKKSLNKTLDPAIAARAKVYTNQSGYDLLDQLKDGTGRPMMQPDPTNINIMRILGREVIRLSDVHWPNLTTPVRARIAVGDGTEFLTFFKRAAYEMAMTSIGGSAWRSNSSEVRGIMRADCQRMDESAMALLAVTLPS